MSKKPQKKQQFYLSHPYWFLFGISIVLATIFFSPILFTADYFYGSGTDIQSYQYPLREFASTWLKQGIWPLWNPYIFSGVPFQTGIHTLLYPGTILGLIFSTAWEIKISIWIHASMAIFFMAVLLRSFNINMFVALLAGVAYGISGFSISHLYAGHVDILITFTYLPLIIYLFERSLKYGGIGYTIITSLVFSLTVFSGHYQIIYISIFTIYTLYLCRILVGMPFKIAPLSFKNIFLKEQELRHEQHDVQYLFSSSPLSWKEKLSDFKNLIYRVVILGATSIIFTLVQLIPLLENTGFSNRSVEKDFAFAKSFGVPITNWLTYLAPDFFGGTDKLQHWAQWSAWEGQGYVGIVILLLLFASLWLLPKKQWIPMIVLIAFASFIAMGEHTPLFKMLFYVDPLVGRFRVPSRFLLSVTFFATILASFGAHVWLNKPRKDTTAVIPIAIFLLVSFGIMIVFVVANKDGWWLAFIKEHTSGRLLQNIHQKYSSFSALTLKHTKQQILTFFIFAVMAGLLVLAPLKLKVKKQTIVIALLTLLFIDLFIYAKPKMITAPANKFTQSSTVLSALQDKNKYQRIISVPQLRLFNQGSAYGIAHVGGYDTFIDKRYNQMANIAMGYHPDKKLMLMSLFNYGPFWETQAVSYLISPMVLDRYPEKYQRIFKNFQLDSSISGYQIYYNPFALPRAFLTTKIEEIQDTLSFYREFAHGNFSLKHTVYMENTKRIKTIQEFLASDTNTDQATIGSVTIEELKPNTMSMSVNAHTPSILVISDAPYPGWEASIDKRSTEILWINGGLHRGILVPKGTHDVVMKYRPQSFIYAGFASCISIIAVLIMLIFGYKHRKQA